MTCTACTPFVFYAVSAVMTEAPHNNLKLNVFRSPVVPRTMTGQHSGYHTVVQTREIPGCLLPHQILNLHGYYCRGATSSVYWEGGHVVASMTKVATQLNFLERLTLCMILAKC